MNINWNNVASWARTAGVVASAIQLQYPTSKAGMIASVVVAVSGEVVKQITNPSTFPQTPVVEPKD